MFVIKKKIIAVFALVLLVLVAGIIQYTYNRKLAAKESAGDPVLVIDVSPAPETVIDFITDNEGNKQETSSVVYDEEEEETSSNKTGGVFTLNKLNREVVRADNETELRELAENETTEQTIRNAAYEKIIDLIALGQKEALIEQMIIDKGYSDAIVYFGEDGSVDVVVSASEMSSIEATRIADIVSRQANVSYEKIHIRCID